MPVLQQSEAVGHAVNCATLMVSLADVGVLTGLRPYLDAAQRMWTDAATRKMFVTGGVGTTGNEGFGEPYALPNISAYSETCAVLMFMTLNHRLFLATGDGEVHRRAGARDVQQRAVGRVDDGQSLLLRQSARERRRRTRRSAGSAPRSSAARRISFASSRRCPATSTRRTRRDAVYVNLYVSSRARFKVARKELSLAVESEMPWGGRSTSDGDVEATPTRASIKLRMPGWARNQPAPGSLYAYADALNKPMSIAVNGKRVTVGARPVRLCHDRPRVENWRLDRRSSSRWMRGRVVADTRVKDDRGRVAIERGPIVYCAEWPDCEGGGALDVLLDPTRRA